MGSTPGSGAFQREEQKQSAVPMEAAEAHFHLLPSRPSLEVGEEDEVCIPVHIQRSLQSCQHALLQAHDMARAVVWLIPGMQRLHLLLPVACRLAETTLGHSSA